MTLTAYGENAEKGLDAAVAYGSYDFKFRNNLTNSVKIKRIKKSFKVYFL